MINRVVKGSNIKLCIISPYSFNAILCNNVVNVIDVDKKSEIELFNEFYLRQNNIEMDEDRLDIVNNVIRECLEEEL